MLTDDHHQLRRRGGCSHDLGRSAVSVSLPQMLEGLEHGLCEQCNPRTGSEQGMASTIGRWRRSRTSSLRYMGSLFASCDDLHRIHQSTSSFAKHALHEESRLSGRAWHASSVIALPKLTQLLLRSASQPPGTACESGLQRYLLSSSRPRTTFASSDPCQIIRRRPSNLSGRWLHHVLVHERAPKSAVFHGPLWFRT